MITYHFYLDEVVGRGATEPQQGRRLQHLSVERKMLLVMVMKLWRWCYDEAESQAVGLAVLSFRQGHRYHSAEATEPERNAVCSSNILIAPKNDRRGSTRTAAAISI